MSTSVGTQTKNAAASADQSGEQARRLWEEAVAAKGGRDRLRNVSSLFVKSDSGGGDRGDILYVFPDYFFEYSYWAQRERGDLIIYNARRNVSWWQLNGYAAKPLKDTEDQAYAMLEGSFLYLLLTRDAEPTPLGARKGRVGFKRVDVVETDVKGWRVDYYLDPDTHLPIKVAFPNGPRARDKGEMNHLVSLEDYVNVDGVMMPRKEIHSYTFNWPKQTNRLSFEINPKYDPQIFEQPPTPRAGVESWRPKANR